MIQKSYNHYKIWQILFTLYVLVLPFGTALINITYGLIILFWLLELVTNKISFNKKDAYLILAFSGFYLFSLITYFYSYNTDYALRKIMLQSYLLIFPVIIITKKDVLSYQFFIRLIQTLSISLVVLGGISITNQLLNFINERGEFYEYFTENNLSTSVIDIHFLGLSLILSFILIINVYIKCFKNNWFSQWFEKSYYFVNIFLFVFLLLLNSRSLIVLTLFFVSVLIFALTLKQKKRNKALWVFLVIFIIMTLNVTFNKAFNSKIKEAINYDNKQEIDKNWGGTAMRYIIWDCAVKVIKENAIFGVGIGDQQDKLTLCYKIYMRDQILYNKNTVRNGHNIFIQVAISSGIIGLFLLLLSLGYPLLISIKTNPIYVCFVSLLIIAGLTESYLERNVSLAFFSFFNIVCFLTPFNNENTSSSQ